MNSSYIAGVGTSHFGKQPAGVEELVASAVDEALESSGLAAHEIDAVYIGNVFGYPGTGHRALRASGIHGIPITRVENACASGTLAFHLASESARRGEHRTVLALGFEKMSDWIKGPIPTDPLDPEAAAGMVLPAMYAMSARRYMHQYGATADQLAQVSVKNHLNAMENPRAQYRGDYTVHDILASRPIADPLTLLQCSPISDGAAAAIVRSGVAGNSRRVRIRSSAFASGRVWPQDRTEVWNQELIRRTTQTAFADAGIAPGDVDVLELHDAFTIGELVTLEAMGFFADGEAAGATTDGVTARGGALPVNPSGGLLSRGHPLGATGLAQVAELFWQLTDQAAQRQTPDATIAALETMGGSVGGLSGNGCVVAVLERDDEDRKQL
jgi:acetyl-CoA acetyltransferase